MGLVGFFNRGIARAKYLTAPAHAPESIRIIMGGVFEFYVPEKYAEEDLTFTFSNLYSTDGDETYPNGNGAARYSFVTSDYFENFDGYGGDDGLYSSSYDPESTVAPFRYEDKAFTSVAGNNFFKFTPYS